MTENDLDSALLAYCRGLRADMIQARNADKEWGPLWTIPPCSPVAMERAGRQFTKGRAQAVRHCRRARLRHPSPHLTTDVVVVTEFPGREQSVTRFDGAVVRVDAYLEDEALASLEAAFVPARR